MTWWEKWIPTELSGMLVRVEVRDEESGRVAFVVTAESDGTSGSWQVARAGGAVVASGSGQYGRLDDALRDAFSALDALLRRAIAELPGS